MLSEGEETGLTPADANKAIARGDRARGLRAWAEAAASYGEALKIDPTRAEIWIQYGHALKESGALGDAEDSYRKALKLRPDDADGYLQLGRVLKLMGRSHEAIRAYMQSAFLDLDASDAVIELESLKEQIAQNFGAATQMASLRDNGFAEQKTGAAATKRTPLSVKLDKLKRLVDAGVLETYTQTEVSEAMALFERSLLSVLEAQDIDTQDIDVSPVRTAVIFDVADLVSYFRTARLPTGIQRVQIEVISALIRAPESKVDILICGFSEALDDWIEIPRSLFVRLADLSTSDGALDAEEWRGALARINMLNTASIPLDFPDNAILINLGTSWWLQNYFLHVRRIKKLKGVKYVPFVHDLIPIRTPEHCVRELTQDFITWTQGVFCHADFFICNSKSTKDDLLNVANELGHPVPNDAVTVIHLNGDPRRLRSAPNPKKLLSLYGLSPGKFVLFVSTIESRKNHIGALNAWLSLIRKHRTTEVPKLVCVGNPGWLNDLVHSKLATSDDLKAHVVMISRISDEDLENLYRNCIFTIYPSHYEGWGLPVTESLCYGKIPIVSDSSSLPEAGGEFAVYFTAGSDQSLASAVEGLMFDVQLRAELERKIKETFQPRTWAKIGFDICQAVSHLTRHDGSVELPDVYEPQSFVANLGVYYPISRNEQTRIWPQMLAGEIFRRGTGWWSLEPWGVWSRKGGGELEIPLATSDKALVIFLGLRGLIGSPCRWVLRFCEAADLPTLAGSLDADEVRWVRVDLPASSSRSPLLIEIFSRETQDLASVTDGQDLRITSIGLIGFYICEGDDFNARAQFMEGLILRDFESLTSGHEFKSRIYVPE